MVVWVEYCLFCDICSENWFDDGEISHKSMERRRLAKQDGWTKRKIGGKFYDLCPECEKIYQRIKSSSQSLGNILSFEYKNKNVV